MESAALAIRQGEEGVAAASSAAVDALRNAGLGIMVGGFVGIIATNSILIAASLAAIAGAAAALFGARQRRLAVPRKRSLPDRWALALPPSAPSSATLHGRATTPEPIRSALTGRPCLGYEVGLRQDDDAQGALSSWALLEQHVAQLDVGGTALDGDKTFLDIERERLGPFSTDTLDAPAIEWLRQRGFASVGSTLVVYETILPTDATVTVTVSSGRAILRSNPRALALDDGRA